MGGKSQWQKLASLIDEARVRAEMAAENHESAAAQLDVAEYDLKQIARTLEEVMRSVDAASPAGVPADAGAIQRPKSVA